MKIDLTQLIRPELLQLKPYSSARDEFKGAASIYLDANENPFNSAVNRYPDPLQSKLKSRIAELKKVKSDQLFLGNGSDEGIDLLFRLFCRPGIDSAASITPSYGMYAVSAGIQQIKLKEIHLNNDFTLDTDRTLKEAEGCKLLFICSPNNPTGQCFPKNQLLEIAQRFAGILIIDEAYIDFAEQTSLIEELNQFQNLAVLQTFSKAYGMAGIRLGMLFGSVELISWINKIKAPYNINQLTQNFALERLENVALVQKEIDLIKNERKELIRELSNFKSIQEIFPSDSNFILIRVSDAMELYDFLADRGIIVRNRSNQPLCSNTLRISVGTPDENKKLINAIQLYNSTL